MARHSSDSDMPPKGLVFFSRHASSRHRRRRLGLAVFGLVATCGLIWPVYALVGSTRPFVLGFPFPFAWMIGWLILVFAVLVWFYRTEEPTSDASPPEAT